jgi:ribosome modulation factor
LPAGEPDNLSLERAGHQGREAFFSGQSGESCPYRAGTAERTIWLGAWLAARDYREMLDVHLLRQA